MVDLLYEVGAALATLFLGYLIAHWQYQTFKKKFGLVANNALPAINDLAKTVNDALADDVITPDEAKLIADKATVAYDAIHLVLHDP